MNRVEFTKKLSELILVMCNEGEFPILDFVKRSDAEQMRLYKLGLTRCDGINKVSQHQRGRAADIYFLDPETNQLSDPKKGWLYWHKYAETHLGFRPMIEWDKNHWEV